MSTTALTERHIIVSCPAMVVSQQACVLKSRTILKCGVSMFFLAVLLMVPLAHSATVTHGKFLREIPEMTNYYDQHSKKFMEEDYRVAECQPELSLACVKRKVVTTLYKILNLKSYKLFDGVEFERLPEDEINYNDIGAGRAFDANIPEEEKEERFEELVYAGAQRIFDTRSLKLSFIPGIVLRISPSSGKSLFNLEIEQDDQTTATEGRGKDKNMGVMALPLLFLAPIIPLILGGLKLIIFKALAAGKISLVLSALTGLKNLSQQGGQGGYADRLGRSLFGEEQEEPSDAQTMAYRSQIPNGYSS